MKSFRVIGLLLTVFILAGVSAAANPDGTFSGTGTLTDFFAPDKPTKVKKQITLEFNDVNSDSTFRVDDDMFPSEGSAFRQGRYLFVQYETGAVILGGRLLVKGGPGSETRLIGILTATHNGYVGSHEWKVNLKRVKN